MSDNNHPVAQSTGDQNFSSEENTVPYSEGIVSNAVSVAGAVGAVSPSSEYEIYVYHLRMILHALRCPTYEILANGELGMCSFPECSMFKQVLAHMTSCQAENRCTVPHCFSSRWLIFHWNNCTQSDCPICVPLKQGAVVVVHGCGLVDMQRPYAAFGHPCNTGGYAGYYNAMLQSGQAVPGPNVYVQGPHCSSQSISHIRALQSSQQNMQQSRFQLRPVYQSNTTGAIPPSYAQMYFMRDSVRTQNYSRIVTWLNTQNQVASETINDDAGVSKDWYQSVSQADRQHSIQRIVQTIFPTFNVNAYRDQNTIGLVACAEQAENAIYRSANSRDNYYCLIARKMHEIKKVLEEITQNAK